MWNWNKRKINYNLTKCQKRIKSRHLYPNHIKSMITHPIVVSNWQKVAFLKEEFKPFIEEYLKDEEFLNIIDEYCEILINKDEYYDNS